MCARYLPQEAGFLFTAGSRQEARGGVLVEAMN